MRFRPAIILLVVALTTSCAIQQAPEGGLKDIVPPKLLQADPPNFSTGFKSDEIALAFDELIALNELTAQLIISPLLKYPPEFKIRKKTLYISISDTLLPNTTYTMNFGAGLMDNNEGNKLEDFQYVFSTGDFIDSMKVSGIVERAFDKGKEKSIIVALYTDKVDSLPYLHRPLYFGKTDEDGNFIINNISSGKYQIVALKDADGDYLFNGGEELIGYSDTMISSGNANLKIRIFQEKPKLTLLKAYSEGPGKAVLVFNGAADTVKWNWISDKTKLDFISSSFSPKHDSIFFWYKNITADSLSIALNNYSLNDTIILRLFKKQEGSTLSKGALKLILTPSLSENQVQHLYLPFTIQSNHLIDKSDLSKVTFLEDSQSVTPSILFADTLHTIIKINHAWKSRSRYNLSILPGTFTDIFGLTDDTLNISFSAHSETDYGSVAIKVQKFYKDPVILQLTDEAGVTSFRESIVKDDITVNFENLDPGKYRIKIIRDANNNGKWDTGNYLKRIQPEQISFYAEPIVVRANWDVEIVVKAE